MNSRHQSKWNGSRVPGSIFLAGLLLLLTGCSLRVFRASPQKAEVGSLRLGTNAPKLLALTVVQAQVMRFADTYVANIAQACDDLSAKATNPAVRLVALQWKLGQATSAYIDATGQNSALNALDMLVLVTMARMVVEDYGVDTYGDAILPLLKVQRQMETNAWTLAGGVLKPEQQQELRELIQVWREKNPHQRYIGPIRFRQFVTALGRNPTPATTSPTSVFSLLFLDPFAGLDPTAAAIQETRELGERAMYYSQRMPGLLNWQAQVLVYQLAEQPESRQVLSNAQQIASSVDIFAKTSQQLPQLINDQRRAAIQQLLDGLQAQDADVRQTLNAGADAATAINDAIQSLDHFVRYVSTPDTNPTSVSTNRRPFNVLDYGTAASQVGVAAKDLTALLVQVNESAPQLARLSQQSAADAKQVADHAFRLGLILIAVFLSGSILAGLAYRVLAKKLNGGGPKLPGA